jgi:hypothetical protein
MRLDLCSRHISLEGILPPPLHLLDIPLHDSPKYRQIGRASRLLQRTAGRAGDGRNWEIDMAPTPAELLVLEEDRRSVSERPVLV